MSFIASLNTKVRTLFEADIPASALVSRILEMGGKGCAITDRYVLSAIEDYRRVFKDNNLTLIPGCEFEIPVNGTKRTLIVLAKDDEGYKGLGKLVTESNLHLDEEIDDDKQDHPMLLFEDLKRIVSEYKGHLIALSGSITGVVPSMFFINEPTEELIEAKRSIQRKFVAPYDAKYLNAKADYEKCSLAFAQAEDELERVKRIAGAKFKERKDAVAKMLKNGEDGAEKAQAELNADMAASAEAKKNLPALKEALASAKKSLSQAKKEFNTLEKSVDEWGKFEEVIEECKKDLVSPEDIYKRAENNARLMCNIFGKDDFYIELENHGTEKERFAFPKMVNIAKSLGIGVVATNDVHILKKNEDEMIKTQILVSLGNDDDKWVPALPGDDEKYLKTDEELAEALLALGIEPAVVDEAIGNIAKIFDACNVEFKTGKHYPVFADDVDALFDSEIEKGVKWRFPEGMDDEHKARLEYEVGIIKKMGYANYHLIVKDFLEYGRLLGYLPEDEISSAPLSIKELEAYIEEKGYKNGGLTIGPGRGSAVGSLACFCLGITALDPIPYGLLFERFLNPERVSMPDIDSDISKAIRPKVIEYVMNKYGEKAVCGILTTLMAAPKKAIRITSKYYGLKNYGRSLSIENALCKDIPSDVGTSFASIVDESGQIASDDIGRPLYDYLRTKYEGNVKALDVLKWAKILEGSMVSYGTHAAGIVISDNNDISDYLPLKANTNLGYMTTQCDMVQVEDLGLLKFDFLGLITLDIITGALRAIEKKTGLIIDPLKISLNDSRVYAEIFSTARTAGIFQFCKPGVKKWLKKFHPTSFDDIIIINAMNRPGPMQYLDGVCDVKNGVKEAEFLCDELKPILSTTYGAIVYQEQVMEIFQKLAGYSLGGADMVRRYMSKKKADKLAHEREAFINGDPERGIAGCVANGISATVANDLFDQMMAFASYAFNKSHALAYSFNAYICAWLKLYYPLEFFASAFAWAENVTELSELVNEALSFGIKIQLPAINVAGEHFVVDEDSIIFGLGDVKGVSGNAKDIVAERKNGIFTSLYDFLKRCKPNKGVFEHLVYGGVLDSFCPDRKCIFELYDKLLKYLEERKAQESVANAITLLLPVIDSLETDLDVQNYQYEHGSKALIKSTTNAIALQEKLDRIKSDIRSIDSEAERLTFGHVGTNTKDILNEEREHLGAYISANPLDLYPSAKDMKCDTISELSSLSEAAYGMVTDLKMKKRKKDGADMAFFTLTDRSGQIEVAVFTEAYAKFGSEIAEGNVVYITGECNMSDDDDGKNQFVAKTVKSIQEAKEDYVLSVKNDETYKKMKSRLQDAYCDPEGHTLLLFSEDDQKVYAKCTFKVKESILDSKFFKATKYNHD